MTVDITALSRMVRRLDVSATIKTFTAVVAFLVVLMNLGKIFAFVQEVLHSDMFDLEESGIFIAAILTAIVFAFGPLAFIFWDWMARRPWRHLAAIVGALIGAIGFAAIGGGIGFVDIFVAGKAESSELPIEILTSVSWMLVLFALMTWLMTESGRIRLAVAAILGVAAGIGLTMLLHALLEKNGIDVGQVSPEHYPAVFGYMLLLAATFWLFVRAIHHRIVLSGDRPRELMLGALHRKGLWVRLAFLTGLPSSLWNVRALGTAAFWAFLLSRPLVYAGVVVLFGSAKPDIGPIAALSIGAGLIVAGHLLFYAGKRLAARYIWVPENPADSRQPVLFLRSFENDQLNFNRSWWDVFGRWFDLWSFRRNADEAMIDEIAQYGPVVALGMPGEKRIPFGAKRYYATHDDWQRIITDTARNSQAIVIGAGDTPGVQWEYELLARENLLDRTLLLFSPEADQASANSQALAAFARASNLSGKFDAPDDTRLIALLPTNDGPALLTARDATAAAHVVAVRAHFQKCTLGQLADTLRS